MDRRVHSCETIRSSSRHKFFSLDVCSVADQLMLLVALLSVVVVSEGL
jgi:hypothetical protein